MASDACAPQAGIAGLDMLTNAIGSMGLGSGSAVRGNAVPAGARASATAAAGLPRSVAATPTGHHAPPDTPLAPATFKPLRDYQEALVQEVQGLYRQHQKLANGPATCRGAPPFRSSVGEASGGLAPAAGSRGEVAPRGAPAAAPPSPTLLYLPTGGGKTRIAAELVRWVLDAGGRAVFVVNRSALVPQAAAAFAERGLADEIGYIKAGMRPDAAKRVQIASVQTLASRAKRPGARTAAASAAGAMASAAPPAGGGSSDSDGESEGSVSTDADEGESGDAGGGADSPAVLKPPAPAAASAARAAAAASEQPAAAQHAAPHRHAVYPLADLVIIDEAHAAVAATYTALLRHYLAGADAAAAPSHGGRTSCQPAFILGLTATPLRLRPEEELGRIFHRLLRGPSVASLVARGFLVPPVAFAVAPDLVRQVLRSARRNTTEASVVAAAAAAGGSGGRGSAASGRVSAGQQGVAQLSNGSRSPPRRGSAVGDDSSSGSDADGGATDDDDAGGGGRRVRRRDAYDEAQLSAGLAADAVTREVVAVWQRRCAGRRTLAFAVDVAHSRRVVAAFTAAAVPAAHVDGDTPQRERERLFASFRDGSLPLLCSVGVLSEGFDEPRVSATLLLRPTASRGLYIQQVGRGLRPAPGKHDCVVLDLVGNTLRHGPVTRPAIAGFADGQRLPEFHLAMARNAWERDFLLSVAAQVTPGAASSYKRWPGESRALSEKQRQTLADIVAARQRPAGGAGI